MKVAILAPLILAALVAANDKNVSSPNPTPAASTPCPVIPGWEKPGQKCTQVSVEGDATYCIAGPICSGSGAAPTGSLCPKKGDVAVKDCLKNLKSYADADKCVAPVDAQCVKIKTGAWGCVFGAAQPAPTPAASTPCPVIPGWEKPAATPAVTTPCPVIPGWEKPAATAAATPAATTPCPVIPGWEKPGQKCTEVSVEGDATYCIAGPVCSGSGASPAGSQCPKKGDVAVKDCLKKLKSYADADKCIAPADAQCVKIKTGAWGCVFGAAQPAATTPCPVIPGWEKPAATPAATTPCPVIPGWEKPAATAAPTPAASTPCPEIPGWEKPAATPAATTPCPVIPGWEKPGQKCTEVSVEGDATYCIAGPVCSGSGAAPAGSQCPKKGDVAVKDCLKKLKSYADADKCIAPADAKCVKIKTGAWGCVFGEAQPAATTPCPVIPGWEKPAATPAATTPCPVIPGWEKPQATAAATPAATTPCPVIPGWEKPAVTPAATTPCPVIPGWEKPTPAPSTPCPVIPGWEKPKPGAGCTEVSVEGDATYCIAGPICSGSGAAPAGSLCPKKGDVAVKDCLKKLKSYADADKCIAPIDAQCVKIKTGAWGCVFGAAQAAAATPAVTMPCPVIPGWEKPGATNATAAPKNATQAANATREVTVGDNTTAPTPAVTTAPTAAVTTAPPAVSNDVTQKSFAATESESASGPTYYAAIAAVGAVAAVAGVAVAMNKRRQQQNSDDIVLSPSVYEGSVVTPM